MIFILGLPRPVLMLETLLPSFPPVEGKELTLVHLKNVLKNSHKYKLSLIYWNSTRIM